MSEYYVYEWIRLDTNEPFYVGKGKGKRWNTLYNRNRYFHNVLNKVGMENVAVVFLHRDLTEHEAHLMEKFYIHYYKNSLGFSLTNLTDGGDGVSGLKHDESTRKLISQNVRKAIDEGRGFLVHTPESKKKISDKNKGSKNGMYGKGYKVAGEKNGHYGKIGHRLGIKHTKEDRKKISEKLKASYERPDRKQSSLEHLKKLNESQRGGGNPAARKVTFTNIETGEVISFSNMKDSYAYFKTHNLAINNCVKNNTLFRNMYKVEKN